MSSHVVVIGYGTKGRAAVDTLTKNGWDREAIVVVDPGGGALQEAHADGLAVVTGDATRQDVLRRAGVKDAEQVIITTNRDDSNVLATLTVRQLNPEVWIVAAVREQENVALMKQSGANSVITSSDAVGRLLGLSSLSPSLGSVMEDLLTYGGGLEVAERDLLVNEVGQQPQSLPDQVIAVVRDEKVYRYYDPVVTLTWAAAVTEHVGLGTSVMVVPQHHPLELANALASLDALSGGRLTLGVGVGWSEAEFTALDQDFRSRGRRTDEIIEVLRACWRDDPVSFHGEFYDLHEIRVLPQPAHDIAIWVGGGSEAAHRRGVERGDGFQVIGVDPEGARVACERLRRDRPEDSFTISLRTGWDPQGMDPDRIRRERDEFAEAGIQHVVSAPWRATLDDWLRSMDLLASLVLDETRRP